MERHNQTTLCRRWYVPKGSHGAHEASLRSRSNVSSICLTFPLLFCSHVIRAKPWKVKLKAWGFKRNLTVKDAAHILRCLDTAPSLGCRNAVLFTGKKITRHNITKYIQRTKGVSNESDLLSRIAPEEPTPNYIKYLPLENSPPSSGSTGTLPAPTDSAETSPIFKPMRLPSPVSTPPSPPESRRSSDSRRSEVAYLQNNWYDGQWQDSAHIESFDGNCAPMIEEQAIPDLVMPFKLAERQSHSSAETSTTQQLYAQLPLDITIAALSSDPIDLTQLGIVPTDERHSLGFDSLGRGDYSRCSLVNNNHDYAALFVDNCLYWCYCVGQDNPRYQQHADYHLQTARSYYVCMLQDTKSPGESCLSALSVMTTLFDCLGHTRRLLEVLTVCDQDTKAHFGANNPLTKTIAFKKNFLQRRERGDGPLHDLEELKTIYEDTMDLYPKSLGPALTAGYNWAWAMLEMRHYQDARRQLEAITVESRAHFGEDHIQTIMSAATLARATLRCNDPEKAREIIVEKVCPSVGRNFPKSHPYTWEANHRHAFFLQMLAKDADENSRNKYLWTAEELLREVVIERHRVLGGSNPKSVHSFLLLKNILKLQGRPQDAANLWAWCQFKLSRLEKANFTNP